MNPNVTPKPAEQSDSAAESPWSDLANMPDFQTAAQEQSATETPRKLSTAESVAALIGESWPEKSQPPLSETERRALADRESVDISLRRFGNAARENLSPDDRFEVELSLDILDEVSEQLDDKEDSNNAYDILENMVQKYDRLARKAPTPDRRQKYFAMAQIASKQQGGFTNWKAIDQAENLPKSELEKAFDISTIV